MLVLWKVLNGRHTTTAQCSKGVEQKRWRLVVVETMESVERDFQAYVRPLDMFSSFKYFGWILTALGDYRMEVVGNLCKAWKNWVRLERILGKEGDIYRVKRGCSSKQ